LAKQRDPVVWVGLVFAYAIIGLSGLAMALGSLALLGWVLYAVVRIGVEGGIAIVVVWLLGCGVAVYVGLRVGLKYRRRSATFVNEYRERMRAKREGPTKPNAQDESSVE
jgi:hypothetical protein